MNLRQNKNNLPILQHSCGQRLRQYITEILKYPLLTAKEEKKLARQLRDYNDIESAHKLITSNLRFVVKVAYKYQGYGLNLLDLIQEGNLGLMKATKKYDPEKGYRFITYAVWWIKSHINSFVLRNWSLVKIGAGNIKRKLFFRLRTESSKLNQSLQQEDFNVLQDHLVKHFDVSKSHITEMKIRTSSKDFRLDTAVNKNNLLKTNTLDPEKLLIYKEEKALLKHAINKVTNTLNKKESFVLEKRLLSEEPQTLSEIGKNFNLSRERIRQIENAVINKLRDASLNHQDQEVL